MQKKPVVDLFLFFLFVIGGLFFSYFLIVVILFPGSGELLSFKLKLADPLHHPEIKMQVLISQGLNHFCMFLLAPWIFIKWKEGKVYPFLFSSKQPLHLIGIVVALVVISSPITGKLVEWNESLVLPSSLSWIEDWARQKENEAKDITQMVTNLTSPFELGIGLVVIALLPALGEELVFRGYLQNQFSLITKSPHWAIWISAFLFSAIHFQFFGFVPRMLLGGFFGYLYYYSGQFHLPVIAHFTNNGMMLILIYLKNKGTISYDIEKDEPIPISLALASLVLTMGLFYTFIRRCKENSQEIGN